jgi:hypothetical protein
MRTTVRRASILVDAIHEVVDIGEIVKMATVFGWNATVEPAEDRGQGYEVTLEIPNDGYTRFGTEELINLAILVGYAGGRSGQQMMEHLRAGLANRQFPLDKPLQDTMEIGRPPASPREKFHGN